MKTQKEYNQCQQPISCHNCSSNQICQAWVDFVKHHNDTKPYAHFDLRVSLSCLLYTSTENLRIFATLRGVPNNHAIKDALDLVGLPYKDKKLFSQYSLGMKQRLAIALAVMHDPELLILDEPINGLDPIGIAEVRSFIRELCDARGKTILISSHILSEISLLADDIGIIDHGALLEEESLAELEQKSSKHIRFTPVSYTHLDVYKRQQ